jgi:hypothetical protein
MVGRERREDSLTVIELGVGTLTDDEFASLPGRIQGELVDVGTYESKYSVWGESVHHERVTVALAPDVQYIASH